MKRISLLALFFASIADFALEHGRIDLFVMTSSFLLLLWTGLNPISRSHNANRGNGRAASRGENEDARRFR